MPARCLNLFATHPPLVARIRALEPDFDGRFPEVRADAIVTDDTAAKRPVSLPAGLAAAPVMAMALDAAGRSDASASRKWNTSTMPAISSATCRNRCWMPPGNRSPLRRSFFRCC